MRLADLVGQDPATGALFRALATSRLAHAYLFDGPAGVGKRTAAYGLGLALCCPQEPLAGCGRCDVCRRVLGGLHPDVRFIAAPAAQLLVDQVQEIVTLAATRPHEAPARLIIVEDADRMNVAASNCLLKTLEEPAAGNHIVLLSALPERLLPTIRSRTQRVRFGAVKAQVLVQLLVARGIDRARAEAAAAVADGSVCRTLELATESDEDALWSALERIRAAAGGRLTEISASNGNVGSTPPVAPLFDTAAELGDKEGKGLLRETIALLGGLYRDALAQAVGAPDLVLLRQRRAELDGLARDGSPRATRRLLGALEAVLEAQTALVANVNAVAALERLMLDLRTVEGPPA